MRLIVFANLMKKVEKHELISLQHIVNKTTTTTADVEYKLKINFFIAYLGLKKVANQKLCITNLFSFAFFQKYRSILDIYSSLLNKFYRFFDGFIIIAVI